MLTINLPVLVLAWMGLFHLLHALLAPTHRLTKLASNLTSLTHAVITTWGSAWLLHQPESMSGTQTLITISSSYFIYDIYYMLRYHFSRMYIVHHLTTLAIWNLCVWYQCGNTLLLGTLFIGEYTNILRLGWQLTEEFKITPLNEWLDLGFKYNFLLARCILAPVHLIYHLPLIINLPMPPAFIILLLGSGVTLLVGSWVWAQQIITSLFKPTARVAEI